MYYTFTYNLKYQNETNFPPYRADGQPEITQGGMIDFEIRYQRL